VDPFRELMAEIQVDLDGTFAETWLLEPRARLTGFNGRNGADVTRPEVVFIAIYTVKMTEDERAETRGRSGNWTELLSGEEATLECPKLPFGADLPQEGDTLRRVITGERFKIAAGGRPLDPGRLIFPLRRADLP
jgi:hypothetical protein